MAREVTFLSISWLKSKRHWRADMAKFITTRTLLVRIKMFLKNAVDWSFDYLCDSLSVISWLHSCNERYQFVRRDWRLTLHAVFILNYPGTRKKNKVHKNSSFFWSSSKQTKSASNNWLTNCIGSILKFDSRVSFFYPDHSDTNMRIVITTTNQRNYRGDEKLLKRDLCH